MDRYQYRVPCSVGQIGKVDSLKRSSSLSSNLRQSTRVNAEVMELVYMLVLETKSCGFESHPRYQMPCYFSGRMSPLHGEGRRFEPVTRYQEFLFDIKSLLEYN